jgi:Ca2+-binding EF-hand superfamily protein
MNDIAEELKKLHDIYDDNGDGEIDIDELKNV